MVFRYEYPGGVWVDLEHPSSEEIRDIAREFSISERLETELLFPTPSPLVAGDEGSTLLVLHFPVHEMDGSDTKNQEVDVIVGRDYIITVRYEIIVPLHHLKKLLETQRLVADHTGIATDVLLEILFMHLYTSVRDHTDHAASNLAHIEKDMFDGHERTTVRAVSNINREFLHLESTLANQEDSLNRFLKALIARGSFGTSFNERAERILAERSQIARLITTHRAGATELRETNIALLEVRQNEIMKTLTIITVIVFPLELIAVTLGIHAPGTPALVTENPNAFWIILGIMLATVTLMVAYFARRRWLS